MDDTPPFPNGFVRPVPITDLLDRVPFSPSARPREAGAKASPSASGGPTERTFELQLPTVERVGALDPVVLPPPFTSMAETADAPSEAGTESAQEPPTDPPPPAARPSQPRFASLQPLPSWGIAVIGGLSLLCLALAASLAVAVAEPARVEAAPPAADTQEVSAADVTAADVTAPEPAEAEDTPTATPASFTAEPTSIPVELLTRLEEASDQPLEVELSRLLEAIQFGFGRRSAQLEPTLRSYVYRMGSRFEWNPDSFRVAVTAPDPALASARAAQLERLFEDAVAAGRLDVGTGIGPHALTLVTE